MYMYNHIHLYNYTSSNDSSINSHFTPDIVLHGSLTISVVYTSWGSRMRPAIYMYMLIFTPTHPLTYMYRDLQQQP